MVILLGCKIVLNYGWFFGVIGWRVLDKFGGVGFV